MNLKDFLFKMLGGPPNFETASGYIDTSGISIAPTQLSAVHRCVTLISDTVAQMDLRIMSAKGSREEVEHDLTYLLNRQPNRLTTRHMLFKNLVQDILLHGNGFILISRDNLGNATAVYYVPCNMISVMWDGRFNSIPRYSVEGIGDVSFNNIVHVKNATRDGVNGISVISAASSATRIAAGSESQANKFFENGANCQAVINVPQAMNKQQREDAKQAFADISKGGLGVLSGGSTYQPISINPKDAQLLESRKFSGEEICRFFGVDPIRAYYSSGTYAGAQMAGEALLQDTIQPLLDKIQLELWSKIFYTDFDRKKYDIEFKTSDYLRIDPKSHASYYSQLYNMGVMTTNEIRSELSLPPVADGDKPRVQTNTVPINYQVSRETDNKFK